MRQAVGPKALQLLRQGGEVAAGVIPRSGKRGQCQNQQKNQGIPHPVPFARRCCRCIRLRLVRQALRRQGITPVCVFTGSDLELEGGRKIYGKALTRIPTIGWFADAVSKLIQGQIRQL
jgi:hypothetical protein